MIRFTDAARLALTKLQSRKVRLFVTIFVAGLLFSGLAAASYVARGAFRSVDSFSREGFGERFIVSATDQAGLPNTSKPEIISRAQAIHKDTVTRKKAEAKRLGIEYDEKTDRSPIEEYDGPNGKERNLNIDHPAGQQALKEYIAANPLPSHADLQRLAASYQPKAYYQARNIGFGPDMPSLKVLKDGKEPYDQPGTTEGGYMGGPFSTGTDSFTQSWSLLSGELMKPFMLDGTTTALGPDGSLPVSAPVSAVEQLLKLQPLPSNAKPTERLARIRQIREGARNLAFQVCYRNKASADLLNQAINSQKELEQNKNNRDYQRPNLMYGLPKDPCGAVTPVRDVRTAEEKSLADKQQRFNLAFGDKLPEQALISFRVVGVNPDPPQFNASVVTALISSLVTSTLGTGWYTPLDLRDGSKPLAQIFSDDTLRYGPPASTYYAEFASADTARNFLDEENCQPDFPMGPPPTAQFNPFDKCKKDGKPFMLMPYGSNSLALESAKSGFGKVFRIVALVVAAIAAIIMIGTVGRIIADSRRETAVFRAIGAKKTDISLVYVIYTVFLSLLISAFAVLAGFLFSQYVHGRYSGEFTVQSLVAYNAQDLSKTFNLYAFHPSDMLYLIGLTLLAGIVSAILPLLRNLRRNPIRDMRDEN